MNTPLELSAIAATGVNLDISSQSFNCLDIGGLLDIVVRNGGHLTISGKGLSILEVSGLATKGRQHLTVKI